MGVRRAVREGLPEKVPTDIGGLLASFLGFPPQACQRRSGILNERQGNYRETPLMVAAEDGSLAKVRLLVEAGADPDLFNVLGDTALDLARKYDGYADVVAYLDPLTTEI